jgi:hypothetical protein
MSFEEVFTEAFNKYIEDKLGNIVEAHLKEELMKLENYIERETCSQVEDQLSSAVEEHVNDALDNASFEDHFDINDAVADCLADIELSDHFNITDEVVEAVDEHMSEIDITDHVDVEQVVQEAVDSLVPGHVDQGSVEARLKQLLLKLAESL